MICVPKKITRRMLSLCLEDKYELFKFPFPVIVIGSSSSDCRNLVLLILSVHIKHLRTLLCLHIYCYEDMYCYNNKSDTILIHAFIFVYTVLEIQNQ